ncbi:MULTISPECIES: hypothetical protein [Desulfitobacterium]|uniref:hypothetical protein n=1 Tax=Desulfitobacterium TaxID=36853 RepID=UPI00037D7DC9|nr:MULTISPECIES: hypothetical protein [Desulfitobacterium]
MINSAEFDRMLEIVQLYTATLSPAPESITFHSKEELYRMLDEGLEAVRQGNVRPIEEAFPEIKRRLGFDV